MKLANSSYLEIDRLVERTLHEDIGAGDVTTDLLFPAGERCKAILQANEEGILAGSEVARLVFSKLDPSAVWSEFKLDGEKVATHERIAEVEASQRAVLTGERVALNFLQHLSGIASITARFVAEVDGFPVKIRDTRKTVPGLRTLEKYAVQVGGGMNHRRGLDDGIVVKNNHIKLAGGITACLQRLKSAKRNGLKIEVETSTLEEVREALQAGADIIMFDNMSQQMMKEAVSLVRKRVPLEASGGVTLENVRAIAETGVDYVSIGRLTHSAAALDIALYIQ